MAFARSGVACAGPYSPVKFPTKVAAVSRHDDGAVPIRDLGLMIAGMLAAYVSTIVTHLNWGASYLVHDGYRRFVRPDLIALVRRTSPRPQTAPGAI